MLHNSAALGAAASLSAVDVATPAADIAAFAAAALPRALPALQPQPKLQVVGSRRIPQKLTESPPPIAPSALQKQQK